MSDRRRGLWAVVAFVVLCKLAASTGPWGSAGGDAAALAWPLVVLALGWAWLHFHWIAAAALRRMAVRRP